MQQATILAKSACLCNRFDHRSLNPSAYPLHKANKLFSAGCQLYRLYRDSKYSVVSGK
jgi:hypothetical protein